MNKWTGKTFLHALMAIALFAAPGGVAFAQNYWTGSGAAGLGVAVLVPEGRGLAENEAYLPTMVQGVIVGDFAKFSAIKVLDRQNLDKVIAEGESGFYENENNFVQLGTVANVQYILNGALQKTGSGFSLQLKVTDAASGASKAAYTGNVTAAELENLTGIKKASGDLLAQLGVTLTDAGRTALLGASTSNVQAETALAKGITAQRSGTVVEALSYYYEAAKFDPGLAEAASRGSVLSADITGGNIGQNVRNDIQRRAAWNKTLQEAAAFFKQHPPFEISYDPALTMGKIDYEKETAEMSFKLKRHLGGFFLVIDLPHGQRGVVANLERRVLLKKRGGFLQGLVPRGAALYVVPHILAYVAACYIRGKNGTAAGRLRQARVELRGLVVVAQGLDHRAAPLGGNALGKRRFRLYIGG